MDFAVALNQLMTFVGFEAATFYVVRTVIDQTARREMAAVAAPILILVGAISAPIFVQFKLQNLFVWHMIFFGLVCFAWHRQSLLKDEKLTELADKVAKETGRKTDEIKDSYLFTRRLLSFALVSYFAAFSIAFYYALGQL